MPERAELGEIAEATDSRAVRTHLTEHGPGEKVERKQKLNSKFAPPLPTRLPQQLRDGVQLQTHKPQLQLQRNQRWLFQEEDQE